MFVVVKGKKVLAVAVCVLLAVILLCGYISVKPIAIYTAALTRKLPIYKVDTVGEKKIAISFDASWGADKTRGIVDTLMKYGAKATFFLVGFWVDDYPDEVKYISEKGMEIGNHSKNHLNMSKLSKSEIREELNYVSDKVEALTGVRPLCFRPPFGDYDNELIEVVEECGMKGIQWSVDTLDWKGLSASEITNRVLTKTDCGDIILCHNNSDHILEALPTILSTLIQRGYSFVNMSDLVLKENYYIDNSGVQKALTER